MPDYIPSPRQWVRDQVEVYERSGGTDGTTLRDTGLPVIIVTHKGNKTGAIRKTPLMRVKDGANYVLVGSVGGAPNNPVWVYNLRANPAVEIRDLAAVQPMRVREVNDATERARLWKLAVAAFAPYEEYQAQDHTANPALRRGAGPLARPGSSASQRIPAAAVRRAVELDFYRRGVTIAAHRVHARGGADAHGEAVALRDRDVHLVTGGRPSLPGGARGGDAFGAVRLDKHEAVGEELEHPAGLVARRVQLDATGSGIFGDRPRSILDAEERVAIDLQPHLSPLVPDRNAPGGVVHSRGGHHPRQTIATIREDEIDSLARVGATFDPGEDDARSAVALEDVRRERRGRGVGARWNAGPPDRLSDSRPPAWRCSAAPARLRLDGAVPSVPRLTLLYPGANVEHHDAASCVKGDKYER